MRGARAGASGALSVSCDEDEPRDRGRTLEAWRGWGAGRCSAMAGENGGKERHGPERQRWALEKLLQTKW